MKKICLSLLLFPLIFIFFGCTKAIPEKTIDKKIPQDTSHTDQSSSFKVNEASSVDISGEPSGKIIPEINGKKINNFKQYDSLKKEDQNKVIYDYLMQSLLVFGGDSDGTKELLTSKGFSEATTELSNEVKSIREKNPNDDFNQVMIKLVEVIMRDKEK